MNAPVHAAMLAATIAATSASMHAGAADFTLTPVDDTFAMAAQPNATFGSGGGLNISGAAATNGAGVAQGVTDTWMKFDTSAAIAGFDAAWGAGGWTITGATLSLNEIAAPNSPVFNRGVGAFEVRWVANDDWSEGPGSPNNPGTATGNQVGYGYGLSILDGLADRSLGTFTNAGLDLRQEFDLALDAEFAADVALGAETSLYLTAADAGIGFTFNSSGVDAPWLVLEAAPVPAAPAWAALAAIALGRRRRRQPET